MDNHEKNSPSPRQNSDPNQYSDQRSYAPAAPQAKSNQATTALIALVVVLLIIMLLLSMSGKISLGNNKLSGLSAANSQNQALRANLNAERARQGLPPLPEDSQGALVTAERIQRDATSLVSLSRQWQTELNGKDSMINGLQAELKSRDVVTTSLYKQISDLQAKIDQNGSSSDQLLRISGDLKQSNAQIESYQNQLNTNMAERNKLQLQIDALLAKSGTQVDSSRLTELEAELARIRPEYNSQRLEIQRLLALTNTSRLFARSASELPASAARLFEKLRTLEDSNQQQLLAAYQNIGATMNSEVIHRQTFSVSSSEITFDREKIIQDVLSKRQSSGSYFLVVGYASKSGGAENNRKLSAKRATTVASLVDSLKAANQEVKGVYLGETSRFSASAESANQICEVWEIKP